MSSKTRQKKRKVAPPVQTDWLWSCPPGMPLGEIARRSNFTTEPRTELFPRAWTDERALKSDLYQAFAPDLPLKQLVPHMVWDAFDEHLINACADGHLIVLRDVPTEVPSAVQMLLDLIGSRRRERGWRFFASEPGARFALVLDGWTDAMIRVRSRSTTVYTVQPLQSASAPSQP